MTPKTSTVIFLDFGDDGLPGVAQQLCQASAALPARRPHCRAQPARFRGGKWYIGDRLLQDFLRDMAGAANCLGFVPSAARAAMSPTPLAALADWRNRCRSLPGLAKSGLCLFSFDRAVTDPVAVLNRIGKLTGHEAALQHLPNSQPPPQDPLLLAFCGLALHHDKESARLTKAITGDFPINAGGAAADQAASAAFASLADLRQRLTEREARLHESQHEESAMVALLNARIAALYQCAEKQEAELQALRSERDNLLARVSDLLSSTSWRLTAPLRRLRGGLQEM